MINSLTRHGLASITKKSQNDVVLISAIRTPFCRSYKGSFKDTYPEELLSHILLSTKIQLKKFGIGPETVQDIAVGTVLMELGGAKSGRVAALNAGFPYQTTFRTANRQCSSSLQALTDIAASIQTGSIDCGIAAGTESMTRNYGSRAIPTDLSPRLRQSKVEDARNCLLPMGITSENVAETYGIDRRTQDEFALSSHLKAQEAFESKEFDDEISPIEVDYLTEGETVPVKRIVTKDEGIRSGLTIEKLGQIKPAFKSDGSSTAGNSSQISDGASAVTLMRRETAEKIGLSPIGKFVGSNVVGVPPHLMGIGPALSTPALLKRFGLEIGDIDVLELNEAFASQACMAIDSLKIDPSKVNPKGGAIAIGHPLGATGGRLVCSLIHRLRSQNQKIGMISLCCGTGFGKSALFVAE